MIVGPVIVPRLRGSAPAALQVARTVLYVLRHRCHFEVKLGRFSDVSFERIIAVA